MIHFYFAFHFLILRSIDQRSFFFPLYVFFTLPLAGLYIQIPLAG